MLIARPSKSLSNATLDAFRICLDWDWASLIWDYLFRIYSKLTSFKTLAVSSSTFSDDILDSPCIVSEYNRNFYVSTIMSVNHLDLTSRVVDITVKEIDSPCIASEHCRGLLCQVMFHPILIRTVKREPLSK